ncbi:MAG TPA: DUF6152 family protein [Caulobacteraceae bacterium]|nr:DUF6152 family protein [Caulobacteraceae bacterium]
MGLIPSNMLSGGLRGWRAWSLPALIAAGCALTSPALAHHSAAMFDPNKTVTLSGAVKDYRWTNPHAMIEVLTVNDAGAQTVWSIECSTPNILVRKGWGAHSLKAGDRVSVQVHPLRDGGSAGLIMALTTPSGAVLKDHDY